MGIGSVTSMNSMSGMQTTVARSTDLKNKNIKQEITEVQQQMRELSSKEELSVNEKANEKKKLQKEISNLNTELRLHQDELSKSQKREIRMAQMQEEKEPAKGGKAENRTQTENASGKADETRADAGKETASGNANTGASKNEALAKGAPNNSARQADRIISQSKDGVVILKGAMSQDENQNRSVDTAKKLTEESSLTRTDEAKEKADAQKGVKTSDDDNKAGLSSKEIHSIVSKENSTKQVSRQERIIANISEGIVILKGEISQDERRGVDTEQKEAELDKMEQREEMARTIQSSVLGNSNQAMKPAAQTLGVKNEPQTNAENNTLRIFQNEEQESHQRFYVSLGI